jgi:ATP-dependent Lon protease
MAADFRGDPSSALLEVLDPEQNHSFLDHYLDTEFSLRDVMFIATANVMHTIPAALQDRMEVLRLPGYTLNEKVAIGERYLVPKQLKEHGLKPGKLEFPLDAIQTIIERYTKEAGVRNLEREIASICRKVVRKLVGGDLPDSLTLSPDDVLELLGVPRYHLPSPQAPEPEVGAVVGLAWTQVGGEILHIEATMMRGRGKLTLTGQLGDVMQESAQAALSYIRTRADELGIEPLFHRKYDLHVHIPEGAIPKDGPSAGIGLACALASLLCGRAVRSRLAMTGEITLRGKVLPVGGVKEKILAAYRFGIRDVILPRENEKDLAEIPEDISKKINFRLVESMDQVLEHALVEPVADMGLADRQSDERIETGPGGESVAH